MQVQSINDQGIAVLVNAALSQYSLFKLSFPDQQSCCTFMLKIKYLQQNPSEPDYNSLQSYRLIRDRKIYESFQCTTSELLLYKCEQGQSFDALPFPTQYKEITFSNSQQNQGNKYDQISNTSSLKRATNENVPATFGKQAKYQKML
ncbi:hypothetical protein M3P05_18030 [Sansalvadorimonas sp. 2012CJ34-2]|uniref:Uncharacterized protein n=1 Tax=Parendozoicomonas callyspongiae TaxID=2942213 RepID=A0ABT0PM64_9GAMM|nr:hypothetical protein [Sansalvadorimonas sp. 2012CJ34-2]MCL6271822.1 hypothetical protein [Sansalvadorimonas sp. 2012CJ34-2]